MTTARRTLDTLPNLLSCSRLVLAVGFVATEVPHVRLGFIGLAAATDFLDGWLARRVHATSRWGALLDPIADRVFVLTVFTTFLATGAISGAAFVMLLVRDLATATGFAVARLVPRFRSVEFKARLMGKVVTSLQLATCAIVLMLPELVPWAVAAVAITSLLAIADYASSVWRAQHAT